jgi:hypothetical protein
MTQLREISRDEFLAYRTRPNQELDQIDLPVVRNFAETVIYENEPLDEVDRDCLQLRLRLGQYVYSGNYGKLQSLLREGLLTPELFRELELFEDPNNINIRLDINWLFNYIYLKPEDQDASFVNYVVCSDRSDNHGTSMFEAALRRGLRTDLISPQVWVTTLVTNVVYHGIEQLHMLNETLDRLCSLKVPLPEDSQMMVADNRSAMSTHQFILTQTFEYPEVFKYVRVSLPTTSLEDYLDDMKNLLTNYYSESSLDFFFQVGFRKEHLTNSDLFESLTMTGSLLFYDWVLHDVGCPTINGQEDFISRLMSVVSGQYWRDVVTYLMEVNVSGLISLESIQGSKSLIRTSIRLGFFDKEEWEALANEIEVDGLNCNSLNIKSALGSLSKYAKKPLR